MKKNEYYQVECVDYTHDGLGVVKVEDRPIFVKGMLIGEVGQIKIVKVLKNYSIGRLIELTKTSDQRVEPKCPIYKQCGGCHLQHLSNRAQQEFKTKRVKDTFSKIAHLDVKVNECLMMDEPWHYRNKVQVPIGIQNNHFVSGFYKQHSNDIIPTDSCFIQDEYANAIVNHAKRLLEDANETIYDKVSKKGNIKHILIKHGHTSKQYMVVFITRYNSIKNIQSITHELIEEFPLITTIIHNINTKDNNVVLGDEVNVLYGPGFIEDQLLNHNFRISTHSFYQVNPIQVETLYSKAIEYANLSREDAVIDAYCGIGTISLSLANHVNQVYGVEVVEEAIKDAKDNAKRNNINNVDFICQDAGEFMVDFTKQHNNIDVIFVDPPRKGCSAIFLEQLIALNPKKIIYISCDVATQARDVKILDEAGYHIDNCQPVDMFPHSFHIETIVLLQRQTM